MLSPVGTILIGTDARIDIEYQTKSFMIVHIGENVQGFSDMLNLRRGYRYRYNSRIINKEAVYK